MGTINWFRVVLSVVTRCLLQSDRIAPPPHSVYSIERIPTFKKFCGCIFFHVNWSDSYWRGASETIRMQIQRINLNGFGIWHKDVHLFKYRDEKLLNGFKSFNCTEKIQGWSDEKTLTEVHRICKLIDLFKLVSKVLFREHLHKQTLHRRNTMRGRIPLHAISINLIPLLQLIFCGK